MDRRNFLKYSLAGTAGAAITPESLAEKVKAGMIIPGAVSSDGKKGAVSTDVEKHLTVNGYVKEPSHKIPVVAEADVVVVGGGAAGVAAAVCAARQGVSVILVEKTNYLGGLWTGGLVLPVLATHGKGKSKAWDKATGGFCTEVCDTLLNNGWAIKPLNPKVNPEATKYLLDKLIVEAEVRIVYNATAAGVTMSGNRIESVLIDCNTGRLALRCKMVIDASGDGCVFNFAGDPYEARRYHMTTTYRMAGFRNFPDNHDSPLLDMRTGGFGVNEPIDGLDIFEVSRRQQEHRLGIWKAVEERKQKPGHEHVYLMEVAPTTGLRVTRVLNSIHNVTLEESMEWTAFPDVIGMSGVCDPFYYKGRWIAHEDRPIWQIPYRSLIPQETHNLLVCGRCFGYDQGITWDAREISTCMVTGQAAGTAAALSTIQRCAAKDLDISLLQDTLRKANVRLDF